MRRIYNFLIFISAAVLLNTGFVYVGWQFFDVYQSLLDSKLRANLLSLRLTEAYFFREAAANKEITLIFVGDVMLSRGIAKQIQKYNDPRYPFLKIASITRAADLTFGNLEGPISNRGKNQGSVYSFRAVPSVVEGLKFAGFDILSLANNHILDWGKEALVDTIDILKENGIESIGAGRNYKEANEPLIQRIGFTKIVFFAYTNLYPQKLEAINDSAGISDFDLERVISEISRFKKSGQADIIIVSFHWGDEYQTHSNKSQQKIVRELINAGANLIIGHHPHVVQEIEKYKDGWIAYSLGNFIFDQNFSEETNRGLILEVKIKNKKIKEVRPIEIRFSKTFQPEIVEL